MLRVDCVRLWMGQFRFELPAHFGTTESISPLIGSANPSCLSIRYVKRKTSQRLRNTGSEKAKGKFYGGYGFQNRVLSSNPKRSKQIQG